MSKSMPVNKLQDLIDEADKVNFSNYLVENIRELKNKFVTLIQKIENYYQ